MDLTPDNLINQVPKPEFDSKGEPVAPKIKTPEQVRGIHQSDFDADVDNRLCRAYVQGMLEGKPPYNPQRMKEAGLEGCCNIDWRYGQKAIRNKMKPYIMALSSLPVFLNIRTKFGSPQERVLWGQRISEFHARTLRSWESFHFRYQYSILYLASHGASFNYFNDDLDWRWNVSTMGEMLLPRLTKADSVEFSRMSMRREYEPSFLWEQIKEAVQKGWEWTRNETKDGWHVPSVKQAICDATYKDFWRTNDFEQNEMLYKNKEITYSNSSKIVSSILMWTKEDDGTVTQHIASRSALKVEGGKKKEEFLYKRPKHFTSMRQGVITFTRDIGTNGYFHSIRGTGSDIFPIVQERNKLECGMYDAMKIEMSIPVSCTDEVWNSEMAYVQAGPFLLLREGVKMEERAPRNFSNSVFPGIEMLDRNLADQSGDARFPEKADGTVNLEKLLDSISEIDIMESILYFISWQRLLRESLRRMLALKHINQPGGREAMEFRKLCKAEGIPDEALDQIDIEGSTAMRPIGNGSPQARLFTTKSMEPLVPFFDEQGRNNWVRDSIASLPGMTYDMVDRYASDVGDMRPTQQVRNALRENIDLKMAGLIEDERVLNVEDIPVLPNDDHITHLETHAPAMERIVEQVDMGAMEMVEAVRPLFPLYLHASEHIEMCMDNPILRGQVNAFRQAMHNVGEIITNGQRKLQAMQKKAEENAAKGLDPDGNPLPGEDGTVNGERPIYPDPLGTGQMLTPSEFGMVARTQIHLQDAGRNRAIADQLHALKVQEIREQAAAKAREAKQKLQVNDLKAAVGISTQIKSSRQKLQSQKRGNGKN